MALYDKKTDRINKTRARVTRGKQGKDHPSSPVPSACTEGAAFAMHSALDQVQFRDAGEEEEEELESHGAGCAPSIATVPLDGAQVADQVAECEDEIDRLKQRHDAQVEALRAQVLRCVTRSNMLVCH